MFSKKNNFFYTGLLFLCFCILPVNLFGQTIFSDLDKGFIEANSGLIVKHFSDNTKLIILDESYNPTKQEAVSHLARFFRSNPIVSIEDKFDSEKRNSNFIIKTLRTKNKVYRVTIFFKKNENITQINLLRIELDNESTF